MVARLSAPDPPMRVQNSCSERKAVGALGDDLLDHASAHVLDGGQPEAHRVTRIQASAPLFWLDGLDREIGLALDSDVRREHRIEVPALIT